VVSSYLECELVGGRTQGVRAQLARERVHLCLEGAFTWRELLREGAPLWKKGRKFTSSRQGLQGGRYTTFS
jgi:hypothetical protein